MVELYDYEAIVVENVCELMKWHYYPEWKKQLENLGYDYQEICFNAQFSEVIEGHTPVASSRDRLYVIAWKRSLGKRPNLEFQPAGYCEFCGKEIRCRQRPKRQDREFWLKTPPTLTAQKDDAWKGCLGKYKQNYLYFCECCDRPVEPYIVPAAFVIDWTIPAQTIGARCKKLSPQTLERIAKGIERFGEEAAFIASVYGTGTNKSIERPLGAITTSGGHHGLALSPFLVQYYGRKDASSSINSPVPTLTGAPRHALVIPPPVQSSFIVEYYSKGRIRNLCEPLGGLTTKERFGLVINSGSADQTPSIDRWGYTMLSVTETAGAMGFPCTRLGASKDYAIVGSNAMKHRLVGQAVCPPVMRAIVERLVDLLSSQI